MPRIGFKFIKPRRLKLDEMNNELRFAIREFSERVLKDFDDVTSGWKGARPWWGVDFWAKGWDINFRIVTDEESEGGKKWIWVDKGTKPHRIPKSGEARIVFNWPYFPGSIPGSLNTIPAETGGEIASKKVVMHPGTEARRWTEMLLEKEQPLFADWVETAFRKMAKVSGHGFE